MEGWDHERLVQMQRDDKIPVTGVARTHIYLYIVPAAVAGRWQISLPEPLGPAEVTLDLNQDITRVSGRATLDDRHYALDAATLRGKQFSFQVPGLDAAFSGEVADGSMQGNVGVGGENASWRGVRTTD